MSRGRGYKVLIDGLPDQASWQDLKDFAREYGCPPPRYTDVRYGEGVLEFDSSRDADDAIRKLDGRRIRPGRGARHDYPPTRIKAYDEDEGRSSKKRSASSSRSRSRGRDRRRGRDDRRDRDRSRDRDRDRRDRSRDDRDDDRKERDRRRRDDSDDDDDRRRRDDDRDDRDRRDDDRDRDRDDEKKDKDDDDDRRRD